MVFGNLQESVSHISIDSSVSVLEQELLNTNISWVDIYKVTRQPKDF